MRFIYIKNYLNIPKEGKIDFLKHLKKSNSFNMSNQKVILDDNALLVQVKENSDLKSTKEYLIEFLDRFSNIKTEIQWVKNFIKNNSSIIIEFEDKGKKVIKR